MEQSLLEILDAREQRALRQEQLLRQFKQPLLCFTMNIPGPDKNISPVAQGFSLGLQLLRRVLPEKSVLHSEQRTTPAGPEAFFAVELPPRELKALALELEDRSPMGRVLDLDVLTPEGEKLSRPTPRTCLLCGRPAAVCGRSRAHSVQALLERTLELLRQGIRDHIGALAVTSLLCELYATPKPGLVDQHNSGSHRDMDIFTFLSSTAALWPYFRRCAQIGLTHSDPAEALALLKQAGLQAQQDMLRATGGVNTHKGAIFTLGILCGAAAMLPVEQWSDPEALAGQCAVLARGLVQRELAGVQVPKTTGEKLFAQFGITGARGQAEAGFPGAWQVGLPVLETGLSQGLSMNTCLCVALLHILAATQDTCLIKRGGRIAQMQLQVALQTMLALRPYPDREVLESLDAMFIKRNLSPGGSADLLSAACFFYLMKTGAGDR